MAACTVYTVVRGLEEHYVLQNSVAYLVPR